MMRCITLLFLSSTTTLGALTYPIVDTAQTRTCGPYPGQDAHYAGPAPAYQDNGDGTVTDLVTGLMWTSHPLEMTWAQAVEHARSCRVGGYDDWRLPTIKQLYSLIRFDGLDPDPHASDTAHLRPFIDASVFDFQYGNTAKGRRLIDAQYASCTLYVSTTMHGNKTMFGVNFADGRIKGYPVSRPRGPRGEKTYFVLYVRGNPLYGENRFKDNGDGTVSDLATGLMWMKNDSGKPMDWPAALAYADSLALAGYDDWRLPSAKELHSIVDYSRSPDTTGSAAIDPIFNATPITNEGGKKDFACYWTSTLHLKTHSRSTCSAVYIAFGRALGWMDDRFTGRKTLLDVHGAGAQRSDPITGDPRRFPFGRGPQGDVVRILNMVRCVRGGNVRPASPTSTCRPSPLKPQPSPQPGPPDTSSDPVKRLFDRFDSNGDGQITRREFQGLDRRFTRLDRNQDNLISTEEARSALPLPARFLSRQPAMAPSPPAEPSAGPPAVPPTPQPDNPDQPHRDRPNIVLIYADDLGWTGTSVPMLPGRPDTRSDFYQTPHLEKLAAAGMVFSQAYAPGPMCTPSRAALLTGRTPAQLHITTPGPGRSDTPHKLLTPRPARYLPDNLPTIGTLLKSAGYATALLGKWHIGRNDHAGRHGFDLHDGPTENQPNGSKDDPKQIFSLTQRAIRFITQQVHAGRPFYVQISHYAVHNPAQARPSSLDRFAKLPPGRFHTQPDLAAMTWDLDQSIGLLLHALENLHVADRTYIVFTSDNGAPGGKARPWNSPLKMGKGTLYEGGIRVPLIIAGPDVKSGYCDQPVCGTDLLATFCHWAGVPAPPDTDSLDLHPLLRGSTSSLHREKALLFHFPHYGHGPAQKPQTAIITGRWKLLKNWESGTYQLFDLASDLGESHDLAAEHPDRLAQMIDLMNRRLEQVDAQLPRPNPDQQPHLDTLPHPVAR